MDIAFYLECKEVDRDTQQPATYRCYGCGWPKSGTPEWLPSMLGRPMPYCGWCAHAKSGGD